MTIMSNMIPIILIILSLAIIGLTLINKKYVTMIRRSALFAVCVIAIPTLTLFIQRIVIDDEVVISFTLGEWSKSLSLGHVIYVPVQFTVDIFSAWLLIITNIIMIVVAISGHYIKTRHKLYYIFCLLIYLLSVLIILSGQAWITFSLLMLLAVIIFMMVGTWSKAENYAFATRFIFIQGIGFSLIAISLFLLPFIVIKDNVSSLILQQSFDYVDTYFFLNISEGGYRNVAVIFMLLGFAFLMPLIGFQRTIIQLFKHAHYPVLIVVAGVYLPLIAYCFKQFIYSFFLDYLSSVQLVIIGLSVIQIGYMAVHLWKVKHTKEWTGYLTLANIPIIYILLVSDMLVTISFGLLAIISFMLTISLLLCVMASLNERQPLHELDQLKGLFYIKPYLSSMMIITLLAVTGLPLFSHYFTVFHTFFAVYHLNMYVFIMCIISVFLVAINVFLHMSKLFIVSERQEVNKQQQQYDLSFAELIPHILLISFVFMLGIYPRVFLERIELYVEQLLNWLYEYKDVVVWDTNFYHSLLVGDTISSQLQFGIAALLVVVLLSTMWLGSKQNQKMIHWVYWSASHFACVGLLAFVVTESTFQVVMWKQLIVYAIGVSLVFVGTHFLLSRHMYRSLYEDAEHYEGLYYKNRFMYGTFTVLLLTIIGLPFSPIAALRFELIGQLFLHRYILLACVVILSFAFIFRPIWHWIATSSFPVIQGSLLNRNEQIEDWYWTKREKILIISAISINLLLMMIYNMV